MRTSQELKFFCERLADAAAAEILPRFRRLSGIDNKSATSFDPVTEADRAAEAAMRRMIAEHYPDDGIDGEEYGTERLDADNVWVLDPIDGTSGFIVGLPLWGVLIGMTAARRPRIGMMHQPFVGEYFFGDGVEAAYSRGDDTFVLQTRACASLADATLLTTSADLFAEDERRIFESISRDARLTRFGTDCYGYCMLAAGHADIVIESNLKTQDIVPLIPIIEGAGGVITSWDGGSAAYGGRAVACGDKRLHDELLTRLSRIAEST